MRCYETGIQLEISVVIQLMQCYRTIGKKKIFEAVAGASSDGSIEYEFTEPFLLTAISDEIARFSVRIPVRLRAFLKKLNATTALLRNAQLKLTSLAIVRCMNIFVHDMWWQRGWRWKSSADTTRMTLGIM